MPMGNRTKLALERSSFFLWDYLTIEHERQKTFATLVLGRDDYNIAREALHLYTSGLTSHIILVGGRGRMSGSLTEPESSAFSRFLLANGVPADAIVAEYESTNTAENIEGGLRLLSKLPATSYPIGLVTHAPHSRRALACAAFQAPETMFLSFPDRCTLPAVNTREFVTAATELVGEIDRLREYPLLGYPIQSQDIPASMFDHARIVGDFLRTV